MPYICTVVSLIFCSKGTIQCIAIIIPAICYNQDSHCPALVLTATPSFEAEDVDNKPKHGD